MDLRQAIHEDAVAKGLVQEGEMMTTFIVVSAWVKMDATDGEATYINQLEEGQTPHEAVGLLHMGLDGIFNPEE
jgi:formaldehyde-activating enzyme involved in methanogenesis